MQSLRTFLGRVESTWAEEDVAELEAYAREIETRRTGIYVLSDDERAAIEEGLGQAERGEFATEEELAADRKRYGL